MALNVLNVEGFDPAEWKIERKGREWKGEEFDKRIYQAPEKIEPFSSEIWKTGTQQSRD